MSTPEANRRAAKRWQDRKRAAGMCIQCGRNPLVNATLCAECREKRKIIYAARQARKKGHAA